MRLIGWTLGTACLLGLAGCITPSDPDDVSSVPDLQGQAREAYEETRIADLMPAGSPTDLKPHTIPEIRVSTEKRFASRMNPFSLFGEEMAFETAIRYRIILSKLPGLAQEFPAPVEEVPPELLPVDPPPYRRVAGVYFGDTVTAIIVMEDGTGQIVTPGMELPNTEWRVESISEDEVILVRTNKQPDHQRVRLESAPVVRPSGGRGGQPGQPAGQPGAAGGGAGGVG